MDIKDKVIILTGAARIGIDVSNSLKQKGAKLAVTYLTKKPDLGEDVLYIQANLSKASDVTKVISETKQKLGQIHGLIHMAAVYPRTPWKTLTESDWDKTMGIIAKSAFLMSKAAADEMKEGKIIHIADWSVLTQPYQDYLPYNVAKSAVIGLTKSLAKELAPKITVNAVAPGPILKPTDLSDEDNAEVLKNTPLAKWGGAEEITKAILYLLDADFVTGQILYVDGGRSIA
jgi:pteridine reductase